MSSSRSTRITLETHSLGLDTTLNKLELAVNADIAGDVDSLSGDDGLGCKSFNSPKLFPNAWYTHSR